MPKRSCMQASWACLQPNIYTRYDFIIDQACTFLFLSTWFKTGSSFQISWLTEPISFLADSTCMVSNGKMLQRGNTWEETQTVSRASLSLGMPTVSTTRPSYSCSRNLRVPSLAVTVC